MRLHMTNLVIVLIVTKRVGFILAVCACACTCVYVCVFCSTHSRGKKTPGSQDLSEQIERQRERETQTDRERERDIDRDTGIQGHSDAVIR